MQPRIASLAAVILLPGLFSPVQAAAPSLAQSEQTAPDDDFFVRAQPDAGMVRRACRSRTMTVTRLP